MPSFSQYKLYKYADIISTLNSIRLLANSYLLHSVSILPVQSIQNISLKSNTIINNVTSMFTSTIIFIFSYTKPFLYSTKYTFLFKPFFTSVPFLPAHPILQILPTCTPRSSIYISSYTTPLQILIIAFVGLPVVIPRSFSIYTGVRYQPN